MSDRLPADVPTAQPPAPLGAPGLPQWAGVIADEWDRRLQGARRVRTYREMADADATVGALLYALETVFAGAGYRVEPADDSPEAAAVAGFVEECLDDMDGAWGDTLAELLTCFVFGFALMELVYRRRLGEQRDERASSAYDDGRIGWARWAPRAQETIERWVFDERTGDAVAAVQVAPPRFRPVELPLERCLHVAIRPRKQSPEGTSILRNAFESWYYGKHIMRIEAIGIERDLAGMPVVYVPADVYANPVELAKWLGVVKELRNDEAAGVAMPSVYHPGTSNPAYRLELLSTGGQRQIDTDRVIARYERRMLRRMLADFLTLGDTGVGSFALGSSRSELYLASLRAFGDSIGDAITVQPFRRLLRINGIARDLTPRFRFNDPAKRDLKAFAEAISLLTSAGFVDPDDEETRRYVLDQLDIPQPAHEEEPDRDEVPPADGPGAEPDDAAEPPVPPRLRVAATEVLTRGGELDPDLVARAKAAWDAVVDERFAGLLDAEVAP